MMYVCVWVLLKAKGCIYAARKARLETGFNIKHSPRQHCDIMNRNHCCTRLSSMTFRYEAEERWRGTNQEEG